MTFECSCGAVIETEIYECTCGARFDKANVSLLDQCAKCYKWICRKESHYHIVNSTSRMIPHLYYHKKCVPKPGDRLGPSEIIPGRRECLDI